jgi:ornithine carbamoyltransferase
MSSNTVKDFLRARSLDESEIRYILNRVNDLKNRHLDLCSEQTLILLFEKPSTRTRVSFSRGFQELGGEIIFLGADQVQLSRGESIPDTARTLSRYVDILACRTFEQDRIETLAEYFSGPVINALTDQFHPCQALSDVYTVFDHADSEDPVLAYVGDGNNVCHSLIEVCDLLGVSLRISTPEGFEPDSGLLDGAGSVSLHDTPEEAVQDAGFVYTDVWVSMGEDDDKKSIEETFQPFQVNKRLLSHASDDVNVMHCLPAHRGEEITNEIMDGPRSIVFDQAENRLHVQKALMAHLME